MSLEDYFRKEDEMFGGATQDTVSTQKMEEMDEEGVKAQGRVFNLGSGKVMWPVVNVSSVQDPQVKESVFLPPLDSYISHMLVFEPDTMSTSHIPHSTLHHGFSASLIRAVWTKTPQAT